MTVDTAIRIDYNPAGVYNFTLMKYPSLFYSLNLGEQEGVQHKTFTTPHS